MTRKKWIIPLALLVLAAASSAGLLYNHAAQSQTAVSIGAADPKGEVRIYDDANFKGKTATLTEGTYLFYPMIQSTSTYGNVPFNKTLTAFNDIVSSLIVGSDMTVTFYSGEIDWEYGRFGFEGFARRYEGPAHIAYIGDKDNGSFSSAVVCKTDNPDCVLPIFWVDDNFSGYFHHPVRFNYPSGSLNAEKVGNDLTKVKINPESSGSLFSANDVFTSIHIPKGWKATLYPDVFLSGIPLEVTGPSWIGNLAYTSGGNFQDRISSYKVEKKQYARFRVLVQGASQSQVFVNDSDTDIFVNDIPKGKAPVEFNLDIGSKAVIKASKLGWKSDTETVEGKQKGVMLEVLLHVMSKVKTFVEADSQPTGATIYVDGKDPAKGPRKIEIADVQKGVTLKFELKATTCSPKPCIPKKETKEIKINASSQGWKDAGSEWTISAKAHFGPVAKDKDEFAPKPLK